MDDLDLQTIVTSKPFMSVAFMLILKYAGIQVPVDVARVSYAVAMALNALFLVLMLVMVRAAAEGPKVTAKEVDSATQMCASTHLRCGVCTEVRQRLERAFEFTS